MLLRKVLLKRRNKEGIYFSSGFSLLRRGSLRAPPVRSSGCEKFAQRSSSLSRTSGYAHLGEGEKHMATVMQHRHMNGPTSPGSVDDQVNQYLANKVGLRVDQVAFLRGEFKKFGRNPLDSSLEILAIENGYDEKKVKELFELHLAQLRRNDGLPAEKRSVYE